MTQILDIRSLYYFNSRYLISNLTGYPPTMISFFVDEACNAMMNFD